MHRRQFLKTTAAAGLTAVASGQLPPPKKAAITSSVMLWTLKGSFEQKLETAARAGLQSVELVSEHRGWSGADIRRVGNLLRSYRLGIDLLGATPYWRRMPVSMLDPDQRESLLTEVGKNIETALKLEVPMLLLMSGLESPDRPREEQYASLLEGCRRCGELAAKAGVKLVVEPMNNKIGRPGFFLSTCGEGLKLIKEVDDPHVRLLFDIYHEQIQTGNAIAAIREAAPYTEIFHVADSPGRHEPGTGEINYREVYQAIQATGYEGYIAMEYKPTLEPAKSLIGSLNEMRAAMAQAGGRKRRV